MMSFVCPNCQRSDSLQITHKLELPPDGRSDEISLQIVACGKCAFRGMAVYEESRRGATESWHHDGRLMAVADVDLLTKDISQCPQPGNSRCDCQTHQFYGRTNESGVWFFPFQATGSFNMIWSERDH